MYNFDDFDTQIQSDEVFNWSELEDGGFGEDEILNEMLYTQCGAFFVPSADAIDFEDCSF